MAQPSVQSSILTTDLSRTNLLLTSQSNLFSTKYGYNSNLYPSSQHLKRLERNRNQIRLRPKTSTTTTTTDAVSEITIERKVENATEGLSSSCFRFLHKRLLPANKENTLIICDYISSLESEINPSKHYTNDIIILLCTFSTFFKHTKPFKEMTREDVLSFLDSFRKTEGVDPMHK